MVRRESISMSDFLAVYSPMAKEGKTALEIARAFGIEGDEKKASAYVTVKASQIRGSLKSAAEAKAKEKGLSPEKTAEVVKQCTDMVPGLQRGARSKTSEVVSMIDSILSACDAAPVEEAPVEEAPVEEAPVEEASKRRKRS